MKKSFLLLSLLGLLLLGSCSGNKEEEAEQPEIEAPANNILPYWDLDILAKTVRKDSSANWNALNVDSIISGINSRNPEIKLEKKRIGGDTCYLFIRNAHYLTEDLGSSGAVQYLAEAVINMTAVPGINFVAFDFLTGTHAAPEVYGKDFVSSYKIID